MKSTKNENAARAALVSALRPNPYLFSPDSDEAAALMKQNEMIAASKHYDLARDDAEEKNRKTLMHLAWSNFALAFVVGVAAIVSTVTTVCQYRAQSSHANPAETATTSAR